MIKDRLYTLGDNFRYSIYRDFTINYDTHLFEIGSLLDDLEVIKSPFRIFENSSFHIEELIDMY